MQKITFGTSAKYETTNLSNVTTDTGVDVILHFNCQCLIEMNKFTNAEDYLERAQTMF